MNDCCEWGPACCGWCHTCSGGPWLYMRAGKQVIESNIVSDIPPWSLIQLLPPCSCLEFMPDSLDSGLTIS